MIRAEQLTKDYTITKREHFLAPKQTRTVYAVRGISFTIQDGEKVGLIGLNGSGKSTTIKMLTGILTPTSGTVEVDGFQPWKRDSRFLSNIGVSMSQRSSLFFDIPLRDSLEYYKEVYRISQEEYERRLSEFDTILDIRVLLDTPVRKLSFGQRMKAELVCAMLHLPKVIFLDEPTIGLDVVVKDRIFRFLNMINEVHHCTILLTTHELDNIEKYCKRILVLKQGELIFDGPVGDFCAMSQLRKLCVPVEVYRQAGWSLDSAMETGKGMEFFLDVTAPDYPAYLQQLSECNFSVSIPTLEDVIKIMEGRPHETC